MRAAANGPTAWPIPKKAVSMPRAAGASRAPMTSPAAAAIIAGTLQAVRANRAAEIQYPCGARHAPKARKLAHCRKYTIASPCFLPSLSDTVPHRNPLARLARPTPDHIAPAARTEKPASLVR